MQIQLETIEPGRPPKGAKFFGAVTRGVSASPRASRLYCLGQGMRMRRRIIDPAFWTDSKITSLSFITRLLYIGLWQYADDEGLFVEDIKAIKMTLFPDQKFPIETSYRELASNDFFRFGTANGNRIVEIRHFSDHQTINRPTPSKLRDIVDFSEDSLSPHSQVKIREEKLREVKRREVNNTSHLGNGASPKFAAEDLIALYNETVNDNFSAVEKISEGRLKKARQYLKQFPQPEFWLEVFKELNRSSFLAGKTNNPGHESFRASFDWLLSKGKDGTENAVKVYEGKYRE